MSEDARITDGSKPRLCEAAIALEAPYSQMQAGDVRLDTLDPAFGLSRVVVSGCIETRAAAVGRLAAGCYVRSWQIADIIIL
ncbi:MAG: hypothetical protein ABIT64_03040 [Lysobacteraceae bacterium]